MVGNEPDRFISTFHLEYEDTPGEMPFGAQVAVGITYDPDLSHRQIVDKSLEKLGEFLGLAGQLSQSQVQEMYEASLKPVEFSLD